MRSIIVALALVTASLGPVFGQISVGVALPGVRIGVNVPVYPALVPIPGYPVYYAPTLGVNFFFYDGLYWVYQYNSWYVSSWYDGPWTLVVPDAVPVFLLRVPLRYYVNPPIYFRGLPPDAPPRWGMHWGPQWERRRPDWDHWDRRDVPPLAPLPLYQQRYSGHSYPDPRQQDAIRQREYRYQPRDAVGRDAYRAPPQQAPLRVPNAPQRPAPAAEPRPPMRGTPPHESPSPYPAARPEPYAPLRVPAPAPQRPGAAPHGVQPAHPQPYPGGAPLRQPGPGPAGHGERGGPQHGDRGGAQAPAGRELDRNR